MLRPLWAKETSPPWLLQVHLEAGLEGANLGLNMYGCL